jgi:hypothetical protein
VTGIDFGEVPLVLVLTGSRVHFVFHPIKSMAMSEQMLLFLMTIVVIMMIFKNIFHLYMFVRTIQTALSDTTSPK